MRPIRLTIEGINSFIEPQTVDFDRVGADNLFCVSGVTGSGKTTILDCIVLSLFPKHGKRGNLEDYINLKRNEGRIDFVFEFDGEIYETRRVISRKAGKNSYIVIRGGEPAAEGGEGFKLIGDKIGLEMDEFTNVVVLQQGEFAKFLQATKAPRVALISKLFDLKRFDGVYARFNNAAAREEGEMKRYEGVIETYAAVTGAGVKEAETSLAQNEKTLAEITVSSQKLAYVYENLRQEYRIFVEQTEIKKRIEDGEKKVKDCNERVKNGEKFVAEVKAEENALAIKEKARDELTARKTRIEEDEKRRRDLSERIAAAEREKTDCEKSGERVKERKAALEEQKKKFAESVVESGRLKAALEEEGEGDFAAASDKFSQIKMRIETLGRAKAELAAAEKKLNETIKKITVAEAEWKACGKAASESEKAADNAENALAAARKKLDEITGLDALAEVCSHVRAGDVCPVCGGKVTEIAKAETGDRTAAAAELEAAEKRAVSARARLTEATASARAATATLDELKRAESVEKEEVEERKTAATSEDESKLKRVSAIVGKLVDVEKKLADLAVEIDKQSDSIANDEKVVAANVGNAEKRVAELRRDLGLLAIAGDGELEKIVTELNCLAAARKEIDGKLDRARALFEQIRIEKAAAESGLAADKAAVRDCREVKPEEVENARVAAENIAAERQKLNDSVVAEREKLAAARENLAKKTEAEKAFAERKKAFDKYASLARLTKANAFTEFVAAEYVKDFTVTASEKLGELTGGKYSLEYEEKSGEFFVVDFLAGNERRSVKTLSGGETFLASLSLAIAISRDIARDKNFDFFFIDEGFGTLSPDALDAVTAALDTLSRDTLVGVITHRSELIERIGSIVNVIPATEETGSRIV